MAFWGLEALSLLVVSAKMLRFLLACICGSFFVADSLCVLMRKTIGVAMSGSGSRETGSFSASVLRAAFSAEKGDRSVGLMWALISAT